MVRFAIFTAVSTTIQAEEDKASLPQQEKKCREVATGKGWTESAGPFIVPGHSRTRWVNLRDAENGIPAIREMLESAKAGRYDILIVYDYNRLRTLADPIAQSLASYGVQIYSVNQPVEPLPPEEFNPYSSDSESMMRGMSGIISRWQIADLRRKYNYGVPARVRNGLYALKIPDGYRKPPGRDYDRKAVPIPDPARAPIILEIKDMFLRGVSYHEMTRHLNEKYQTVEGGPWARTTIRKILENPFYAGKVTFRRRKVIRDPRNPDLIKVVKNPNPIIQDGKHTPLYSWNEFLRIQKEFEHRARHNTGRIYPFSGLLVCSECGGRIRHKKAEYWQCLDNLCVRLDVETALEILPPEIEKAIHQIQEKPKLLSGSTPDRSAQLADLERQRKKIQQLARGEIYTPEEARAELDKIRRQVEEIQNSDLQKQKDAIAYEDLYNTVTTLRELPIAEWIRTNDPEEVNPILLEILDKIIVSPKHKITVCLKNGSA